MKKAGKNRVAQHSTISRSHLIFASPIVPPHNSCTGIQPICIEAVGDFTFYFSVFSNLGWDDIWFSSLYDDIKPYTITRVGQYVMSESSERTYWFQRPALHKIRII